ncbi:MAG: alpha/beta fold hydrolase [Verrucomicrobiae bacterium]|nr:alpha/beta fold hydrolase [Verrucomicrobiae bacterium]
MHKAVAKPLDLIAIHLARWCVDRSGQRRDLSVAELERLLENPGFFGLPVSTPSDFQWHGNNFRFSSPVVSPWKQNNVVHGRFFAAAKPASKTPTVILLHGWNQELGYETLFPQLARRLNAAGFNAAMFELPYHRRRKPNDRDAIRNFLASDPLHVAMAIHQALADARALIAKLAGENTPPIGLWGISLGAWLAGLLACVEQRVDFAVLMTPVVRMDRIITELKFCEPIREQLHKRLLPLAPLNLVSHRPHHPQNILIVAGDHDLFAPVETAEELARAWKGATLRRLPHGHISMLLSPKAITETVNWIAQRFGSPTSREAQ